MRIKINTKEYEAKDGEMILDVCRRNGIQVPTLCSIPKFHEGVCRICMVENGGRLTTSCNVKASEGMEVVTESEDVSKARRINLELLWADHAGKCSTCKKNQRCELQNLAISQKIENFHFVPRKEEMTDSENLDLLKDNRSRVVVDDGNACLTRTTELCVECRRCINVCPTKELSFNHRAGDTVVGTAYEKSLDCIFCGQCVKNCPTGAITDKNDLTKIMIDLADLKKMAIALIDPAVLESVAFEHPEIDSRGKLISALKGIGFEKVFDLGFGMELALENMTQEIKKSSKNNLLLNHCPSFNLFVKKYYPQFAKNILTVAHPDELTADFLKTEFAKKEKINSEDLVVISLSSCVAKKKEKGKNLDYVITVRELGRIIRQKNLKLKDIKESDFSSGLAVKDEKIKSITRTGGMAEMLAKKLKVKYIVADGVSQIKNILRDLEKGRVETKIIEAMVCEGGCVNGGGQARKL
ncbi:MAG: [Fe-Fe] hydrogenase large subunit C-terminal domain-containing protein [Candidatus Moranbacteria bacterium]|nr:[Fe-Fe] hydrogenase large subunit C-terminal domain-containing protein [Candidatus Moranbacteria bacterium]